MSHIEPIPESVAGVRRSALQGIAIPVPFIFDPKSFSPRASLRLYGPGGTALSEIIEVFSDFHAAYAGILYVLDTPLERLRDEVLERTFPVASTSLAAFEEPILSRASFQSPGFWEFLAKLNPLAVICDFVNALCEWRDRAHERDKDRSYRNRADEQRLILENALLENKVIAERIEMLRSMQVPNEDILRWFSANAGTSLNRLTAHVNSRAIEGAELSDGDTDRAA